MDAPNTHSLNTLMGSLKAIAEPTRLRLLALLERGELAVSELVQVTGQSQPRISRHLKLMTEAGVLDRFREGGWVFYRLADTGPGKGLTRCLMDLLPLDDPSLRHDLDRLADVKAARDRSAQEYFQRVARDWDRLRTLHVDDAVVEGALLEALPENLGDLLDLGTGTGRMLELLAGRAGRAEGVDQSHDMLTVARANLDRAGITSATVRQADIYQLPYADETCDTVVIHQVLHFLDRPVDAIAEAARVLRPQGCLVVVDFSPHDLEALRIEHSHRRLGFAEEEVAGWFRDAHLIPGKVRHLAGDPLTVTIWQARHD